jgi:DNA-binding beta-propeller fold protein YncE
MSDITWKYIKPLDSETLINDFERENGIIFPSDLKNCFVKNNGGRPSKNVFDTDCSKEKVFKTLLSFNKSDPENIYMVFSVFDKERNRLIPFASDPSGDLLCLQNDNIVLYLHETGSIEKVADSFSELLSKLYSF